VHLIFIADCFIGGVPAVVSFVDLRFGSLAALSDSSGHGGGIVGGCGLARGGVGVSKGAAWGSDTDVAISQYMLGTEKKMKKKLREGGDTHGVCLDLGGDLSSASS